MLSLYPQFVSVGRAYRQGYSGCQYRTMRLHLYAGVRRCGMSGTKGTIGTIWYSLVNDKPGAMASPGPCWARFHPHQERWEAAREYAEHHS